MKPELEPELLHMAVRDVINVRNGRVTAKVALLGTNAIITTEYLPERYIQLKNAREIAERQGKWKAIAHTR